MELLNQLLLKLGLEQNQQLLIPSFNFSSQTDPYFGVFFFIYKKLNFT